ncbi:MAG: polysaccharide deacetylase family protein [Rhodobacter sp.]|uniref:polysaccharide deacetylase family protein n=1 Tax=Pararhodobacter sp. TaxID=2127056 RepID=UPI001DBF50FC|nr:polysaccharide deacetylase family protein [Pararhodobacter sp.]MCB1343795.1 polysaccharide deacetylase family protein [Paracoccaceae bacterium]MCC0073490.1 polysaccharide deacetylase family protein [Rhodobacter sp.]HPD92120.1 polysaccharide deacetylase family protein [Pararhodobacter sp.]
MKVVLLALVLIAVPLGLWHLSRARDYQLFAPLVSRVDIREPLVALTFDDGPTAGQTEALIALLASRGVRATFFVTGQQAESLPAETRALVAAGHVLGNHAFSHRRMVLARPSWVRQELALTDAAIRAAGQTGPILFRPPYGKKLFVLPWVLARQGRLTIMWDVEPDSDPAADADTIAREALAGARPGSIILLHAMAAARTATRAALPAIIDGLRARGFRLVTVPELLRAGGVAPAPVAP